MLTSRERKDYILRLIRQVAQMLAAMLQRKQSGDLAGALEQGRAAVGELLGPLGNLAPRLDSETAAHLVADADVLAAWAEVVAEEAGVHRLAGDEPAAAAGEKRALELALEAHLRTSADRPELLALLARLRPAVDASTLAPRHLEALAGLPADPAA